MNEYTESTEAFSLMDARPLQEVRPGLWGDPLHGKSMNAVRWVLQPSKHPTGLHRHSGHEQYGIVVSGSIEIEVNGELRTLAAGDMYWAEQGITHGHLRVLGSEPAVLVDVFSPARANHAEAVEKVAE